MGKLTAEQVPNAMKLLKEDLPELLLAVGKTEKNDEYWDEVAEKCNEVYQNNKNEFSKHMIIAFADYLDKQGGRMKNGTINIEENKQKTGSE